MTNTVVWPDRDVELPVKSMQNDGRTESFFTQDPKSVEESSQRLSDALDAKHKKANLHDLTSAVGSLTELEQKQSNQLLTENESLFDGTLG